MHADKMILRKALDYIIIKYCTNLLFGKYYCAVISSRHFFIMGFVIADAIGRMHFSERVHFSDRVDFLTEYFF